MTRWLRNEVRKSFAPPRHAVVEHRVFGALDADQIVDALDEACRTSLGTPLGDGFLTRSPSASSSGVTSLTGATWSSRATSLAGHRRSSPP
jgi:hypothetical protein